MQNIQEADRREEIELLFLEPAMNDAHVRPKPFEELQYGQPNPNGSGLFCPPSILICAAGVPLIVEAWSGKTVIFLIF